ncbi:MAG: MinD/ParA family protein [Lachnospiraceae bacterium]|nr:MinD/ParA family protein [Lachnospiraceae bacterium]
MDQAQHLRNIFKNPMPRSASRIIAVTSGKGGVGKSNVSVNLAVQLKKMGKRVLIFDADFGLANVEVMFGAIPKYNLKDVIWGGMAIRDIISYGQGDIPFISGGSGILGLSNISRDQITLLLQRMAELDELADIIIIDTGAGISDAVMEFVSASSEVILVTTPEPSSLTDSYSLLKVMCARPGYDRNSTAIKVVANKALTREDGKNVYSRLRTVTDRFLNVNMELLGVVLSDPALEKAVMQQVPVSLSSPNARSSRDFEELAVALTGDHAHGRHNSSGMAGMFARLLNRFGQISG